MSDRRPTTDELITAMLEARAAGPMPDGLEADIRTAVRAEASRRPWWRRGGGTGRTFAFVGLFLAGGMAATWFVGPGADTSTALTAGCAGMEPIAEAGDLGTGPLAPLGAPLAGPRNGSLLLIAPGADGHELAIVQPWSGETEPRPITHWGLVDPPVRAVVPSPDGSLVAAGFYLLDGCADVVVLRTDGSDARQPFAAQSTDVYGQAWSPGGSLLAVTHERRVEGGGERDVEAATIQLWDPETGMVTDIGAPCGECLVRSGPVWSPDGSRLAVTACDELVTRDTGALATDPRLSLPVCDRLGLAITDPGGTWRIINGPFNAKSSEPLGWLDDRVVLVGDVAGRGFVIDVETGATHDVALPPRGVLSPDRRHLAAVDDGAISFVDVSDPDAVGRIRRIPAPLPYLSRAMAWSPDSSSIVVQAERADGSGRGIFMVPVDGEEPATKVLDGSYGAMAWLPSVAQQ